MFNDIRQCAGAAQLTENVEMILHAADDQSRTMTIVEHGRQIGLGPLAKILIDQE